MSAKHTPVASAQYAPQGYCPNAWIARVDGEAVRTNAGGARRYKTEAAALQAAKTAITKATTIPSIAGE